MVSREQGVHALERFGWRVARRARGSHTILTKPSSIHTLSVPDHKELARGTLRKLLRMANVSVGEFISAL